LVSAKLALVRRLEHPIAIDARSPASIIGLRTVGRLFIDANVAADDAAWAEDDAAAALDYAAWTVDNARLAVLDAIDARAYADGLAKTAGS
jgi:hypothetical protein